MKKLPLYAAALASAALGVFGVAPANADPLSGIPTLTQLSFTLKGATTETNTLGTGGVGAGECGNPGLLNPQGTPTGCENTWGAGSVTQIVNYNDTTQTFWNQGDDGEYLNFIIYGVSDISATPPPSVTYAVDSAGATVGPDADGRIHVDVYLSSNPASLALGPDGRTGYGTYNGVTSGTLWLSLVLGAGCDPSNPDATLCQTLNAGDAPATGSGHFDNSTVIGGTAAGYLTDVSGQFVIQAAEPGNHTQFSGAGICNFTGSPSPVQDNCFNEVLSDPVAATKVPEPSSLSIMGGALALMGAATWLRRHRKAQGAA